MLQLNPAFESRLLGDLDIQKFKIEPTEGARRYDRANNDQPDCRGCTSKLDEAASVVSGMKDSPPEAAE